MRILRSALLLVLILAAVSAHESAPAQSPKATGQSNTALPGKQTDGSVLLPNQWSLRPTGRQVELGDFPINVAVHPNGRFAAVLHSGYSAHQLMIVNISSGVVTAHTNVHETFYGLEFSAAGKLLFCSGASDESVRCFDFRDGSLSNGRQIQLRDSRLRAIPAGIAVDKAAKHLFVANLWADRVSRVEILPKPRVKDILLRPDASPLSMAPVPPYDDKDEEAANKREEASLYLAGPDDTFPYACKLDESRQRLYVSLWAQAAVAAIDLKSDTVIARWPTQEHPCEMALTRSGKILFVANANRNTVTVIETASGKTLETIWAALYPNLPRGSTPNSLALTPDEKTLFVANADNNILAVFDVSTPGKSRSLGFIPAGWYPTSVRVTPDGKHLLVANGKGIIPKANPLGPQPGRSAGTNTLQLIASLFRGTLSIIDLPSRKQFEEQLKDYTAQAYRTSPVKPGAAVSAPRPADSPIPLRPGDPSPIKYVFYMVKENRTYDQVLGDLPQGNGDASLCLFPEKISPNHHQLARDFVLLDNFYVEAEVSADGHEWSMGAYATDFVEKMWPLNYGHNHSKKFPYMAEGYFPIATPVGGYLWDRALEAGVSYRSYGEWVNLFVPTNRPNSARAKTLQGHVDPWYRGFDLNYMDQRRADRFLSELKRMESEGDMPRLQIVRLPNDHTQGTSSAFRTPRAYVADNDLAFGRIVEGISHSKFWPQTAIFVLEDDAQNGPDHVDAHRSIAFVISPYAKRKVVDSTMYSTSSMLRTIELILGLKPMSQFDAAATPMLNTFQSKPDLEPYTTLPAGIDIQEHNSAHAWGGDIKMNFAREDAVDDLLLNEVIWRSVRGADNPMPAPVRAGFVFSRPADKDDD